MSTQNLDAILQRLPFSDGSGRRRFVTGGLLLIGFFYLNWSSVSALLSEDTSVVNLLTSPTVLIGSVLVIYTMGMLVELFGEVFLVRAASGVFWALGYPKRAMRSYRARKKKNAWYNNDKLRRGVYVTSVPFVALFGITRGFLGESFYAIDLRRKLSKGADTCLDSMPEKIQQGLTRPVNYHATLALKYLCERFRNPKNSSWASKLVTRSKDVAAATTALFIFVSYWNLIGFIDRNDASKKPSLPQLITTETRDLADFYQKVLDGIESRRDFSDIELIKSALTESPLTNVTSEALQVVKTRRPDSDPEILGVMIDETLRYVMDQNSKSDENRVRSKLIAEWSSFRSIEPTFESLNSASSILAGRGFMLDLPTDPHDVYLEMSELVGVVQNVLANEKDNGFFRQVDRERLERLAKRAEKLAKDISDQHQKVARERHVAFLIAVALTVSLLFLYIGFFVSLEQTIVTLLEALSLESEESRKPDTVDDPVAIASAENTD